MLGSKRTDNYLVDYCEEWPRLFTEESNRISKQLGEMPHYVEHYGSTAIPGMRAKPILDMLLGIPDLGEFDKYRLRLESIGYDYAANAGVPNHYVFGRGKNMDERSHLLHIVEFGAHAWESALFFRDRLRNDKNFRMSYLAAKEEASRQSPHGRSQYNEIKHRLFFSRIQPAQQASTPERLSRPGDR